MNQKQHFLTFILYHKWQWLCVLVTYVLFSTILLCMFIRQPMYAFWYSYQPSFEVFNKLPSVVLPSVLWHCGLGVVVCTIHAMPPTFCRRRRFLCFSALPPPLLTTGRCTADLQLEVYFWATVCKTIHPMPSDHCLSCRVLFVSLTHQCIMDKWLDGSRCHWEWR